MNRRASSEDVFTAVSHPIRRRLLRILSDGEMAVSHLAEPFDVTMSALSQHLKALKIAGVVQERRCGRQRLYRLNPAPLKEVHDWAAFFQEFWTEKLNNLGETLRKNHENKRKTDR